MSYSLLCNCNIVLLFSALRIRGHFCFQINACFWQRSFTGVKCRHTRILRERPILHRRKVSRQAEAGISTKMTSHCRHLVAHTFSCSPESMLKCSELRLPGTAYVQAASCGTASRGNVSRGSSRNVLKMSSWNTCHKTCVGRRSFETNPVAGWN